MTTYTALLINQYIATKTVVTTIPAAKLKQEILKEGLKKCN